MSSVIFYAFPSFYYKFVASSSHPASKGVRLDAYLGNACRARLQKQGGRMGVLGCTWWKEGGRAVPVLQSFWQTLWTQSWGRCHLTAAGNHTSWQAGVPPSHSSAVLCFFRLPKGNPAWGEYTAPTPRCPNTLAHTPSSFQRTWWGWRWAQQFALSPHIRRALIL